MLRRPRRPTLFPYTTLFRSAFRLFRRHVVRRTDDHTSAGEAACGLQRLRDAEIGQHHPAVVRSEEHTSELQSRGHLVCRLLLENKKRLGVEPSEVTGSMARS